MEVEAVSGTRHIGASDWDALVPDGNPFLRHAFLSGLESSGCVGPPHSGWTPLPLVARQGKRVVGAVPLYMKIDSLGEYIFDWAWADAAERAGLRYYPKLVAAVPFTPVAGPRLLLAPDCDRQQVAEALVAGVRRAADALDCSSVHWLFTTPKDLDSLQHAGYLQRHSFQLHWQRQDGWTSFDDFIDSLRATTRKQVRRERRRANSHGLSFSVACGPDLGETQWSALWELYKTNVERHGGSVYLNRAFFNHLRRFMPENVVVSLATRGQSVVAAALMLRGGNHLHGRYWGSRGEYDCLHFEVCFYRPIAWALENGIERFEGGAQGGHKLKRGFLPQPCWSAHWLRHPGLHRAVAAWVENERSAVARTSRALHDHTPFRSVATAAEPARPRMKDAEEVQHGNRGG